jgi:putative component of membrane protein insertase Oxa1/YidC/SpoIIIJ protein YidD
VNLAVLRKSSLCLAMLTLALPVHAQELPTSAWLIATLKAPAPTAVIEPSPWDGSLPGAVLMALFGVYQRVVSPQDIDACAFAPTCSHFAWQAIERHGLVRGVLLGADRLLRDHGFSPHAYRVDEATGRMQDDLSPYSAVLDAP